MMALLERCSSGGGGSVHVSAAHTEVPWGLGLGAGGSTGEQHVGNLRRQMACQLCSIGCRQDEALPPQTVQEAQHVTGKQGVVLGIPSCPRRHLQRKPDGTGWVLRHLCSRLADLLDHFQQLLRRVGAIDG